jgi:hypothetical protein
VVLRIDDWRAAPRAQAVRIIDSGFAVDLVDGKTITVPFARYPPFARTSAEALGQWEILLEGLLIRWPALGVQFFVPLLATAKGPLEPWDDGDPDGWG